MIKTGKPFSPRRTIEWIEAIRQAYNENNPYGEVQSFTDTVQMLNESNCSQESDWRALEGLELMKNQQIDRWMNALSDQANPKAVAKIKQSFAKF